MGMKGKCSLVSSFNDEPPTSASSLREWWGHRVNAVVNQMHLFKMDYGHGDGLVVKKSSDLLIHVLFYSCIMILGYVA